MTDQEILAIFTRILRDLLADDAISLDMATTRADVPGWDSMANVNLLLEIEAAANVRFKAAEVLRLKNVGELIELVERKRRGG